MLQRIQQPEENPYEFLIEIKHDYKNVVLNGNWNETISSNGMNIKFCQMCDYPLQLKYKNETTVVTAKAAGTLFRKTNITR